MILILSYHFNPTHDLFLNVTKLQLKKNIFLIPLNFKFTESESKIINLHPHMDHNLPSSKTTPIQVKCRDFNETQTPGCKCVWAVHSPCFLSRKWTASSWTAICLPNVIVIVSREENTANGMFLTLCLCSCHRARFTIFTCGHTTKWYSKMKLFTY